MNSLNLFVPITKVDIARREVWGRAVQEVVDKVDEIFDYATSKPHFEEWSKSFSDATDGKSLGNIRAMHGKVAAGKIIKIDFNDAAKAIDIGAKIVDENEWNKVLEGVYTGYSIGGSYVGDKTSEKIDGRDVKRYTAKPSETSLVDNPCVPTAKFFDVIKVDGTIEKVAFKPAAIEVRGSDEQVKAFAQAMNDAGLTMDDAVKLVNTEAAKRAVAGMLATLDKREFSTDERKAAAKTGDALPDGSFPIKTVGDLENAIRAFGRAKDKAAAKAHIIKRAKALGASDKIPESWGKAIDADLKKGMYNVQDFASCLSCLADVARSAQYDLESETDDSPVPAQLRNCLAELIGVFKAMSEEESTEMLASLKTAAGVGADDEIEQAVEAAMRGGSLSKRLADPELTLDAMMKLAAAHLTADEIKPLKTPEDVRKAILAKAKMSTANMDRLQAAHDHLSAMGAKCGDADKSAGGDLKKNADLLAELAAKVKKLEAQPVPYVTLRTVSKTQDNGTDGNPGTTPGQPTIPTLDLDSIVLDKDDYVYNPIDKTIDIASSRLLKARKLAAKASGSN